MQSAKPKILFVTGKFPAITHTFVTAEIAAATSDFNVHVLASQKGEHWQQAVRLGIGPQMLTIANSRKTWPFPWRLKKWRNEKWQSAVDFQKYGKVLGLSRLSYFSALLSQPSINDIDVIHAYWTEWAADVALPLGAILNVPVIVTVHDGFIEKVESDVLRFIQNRATQIVCPSRFSCDIYKEKTGMTDKLCIIPNGVDLKKIINGSESHRNQDPFVQGRSTSIVAVGRVDPIKRHGDLIAALSQLIKNGFDAKLTIVGGGGELSRLKVLAKERGIEQFVRFTGALSHDEVICELQDADIFALPSEVESFGVVTIEAMAAGLPTIVSNGGASPELVEDGQTGFVFPVGDIQGLVRTLSYLIENSSTRQMMGRAAKIRAETKYSFEKHMLLMKNIWFNALKGPLLTRM